MSYDLQLWSQSVAGTAQALPQPEQWQPNGDLWSRGKRGWQVLVGPHHRTEPEDVPEDVYTALPGVQHMTEVSLEPISAPASGYALLRRTARVLAASLHGVVLDVQTGMMTMPSGVHRFVRSKREEVLDVLELSWFSMNPKVRSREWLDGFVRLLERELPEALPVRYGAYEPPQHRFRELGREHFVHFLVDEYLNGSNPGSVVWYPQRPVLNVVLSLGTGASRRGWQAQRITIDIDAAALRQAGWPTAVERMWRRVAHFTHAFYADVRTLPNQRPGGATVEQLVAADRHPVCSWFWAGVPRKGAMAVAVGPPYSPLWPEFTKAGERDGDLVFLSTADWTSGEDVLGRIGGVPDRIATQCSGYGVDIGPNLDLVYPPVWPFGATHF